MAVGQIGAAGVGAGQINIVLTSTDAVTWVQQDVGTGGRLSGVSYGDGQFVVVSAWGGGILTSSNGVNWVQRSGSSPRLNAVTYGKGQFVAVGYADTADTNNNQISTPIILASTDGLTWVQRESGISAASAGLAGIAYGNGHFVAVGARYFGSLGGLTGRAIVTSTDGLKWVEQHSGTEPDSLTSVAYGNGQFVAMGDGMLTSTDGVNWVQRQSGTQAYLLFGVAYGIGHFVAVGAEGAILQSGSIIALALARKPSTDLLTLSLEGPTGLAYTIQSSSDLVSWRNATNITSAQPINVIFDALRPESNRVFYRAYTE